MIHQHATIEDTVYFWFASNDTSGSGGDGATPLFDVREAGAAAGAIPLLSGTPTLLTHANYPAGCHEIAVAATTGNGFAADDTFSVFCTLAIDAQNPTGFVGSCTLTPLAKASALTTAQNDLDTITGADGVTLATAQGLYAPSKAGDNMGTVSSVTGNVDGSVASVAAINTTTGAIDNVTLVATTTTNTDMRGTDSALLAANINLTGGAVDTVTTLTNKTGFSLAATGLDAIASTAAGMVEIATAVWDRIISKANHNIGQSAGKTLRQSGDLVQMAGAVSDVSPATTGFDTDLTEVDGYWEDAVMIFVNGSANAGLGVPVSTYLNVGGAVTFAAPDDWPVAPVNGDDFVIFANHVHPITQIQSGLATEAKQDIIDTNVDSLLVNVADVPTVAEFEARTPTAAQLAYIVSNSADGKPVTFTGGTTTTAILGNVDGVAASTTDDAYNGRILIFNAGTLDEQATDITDYDGATTTATITAVTTAVTAAHTANLK